MATFMYRRGDGNEGNFRRFIVDLKPADNAYAALEALLANDYIAGRKTRRFIVANVETDGEPEYGIHAIVYEGPDGETAFDAAWLTAELEPMAADAIEYYTDNGYQRYSLREVLDNAALRQFRKANRQ